MKSGPTFNVPFSRKRKHKTDYKKRLALLKSKLPRAVVRLSNNLVRIQIIDYRREGDITLVSVTSNNLKKLGWNYNLKNTPSVYLTALLMSENAKSKGIKKIIFDTGIKNYSAKSKIFAALKAIVDSGIECSYNEKAFPTQDRITGKAIEPILGKKISNDFENIKNKILNK
jgi:large subunit ribosomal protein L18